LHEKRVFSPHKTPSVKDGKPGSSNNLSIDWSGQSRSNTVSLSPSEVKNFIKQFKKMYSALLMGTSDEKEFLLNSAPVGIGIFSNATSNITSVSVKHREAVLRSWYTDDNNVKRVDGKVSFKCDDEFMSFSQPLNDIYKHLTYFPQDLYSDTIASMIYHIASKVIINFMKGKCEDITSEDVSAFTPKFRSAFFPALGEYLNTGCSTSTLKWVRNEMRKNNVSSPIELFYFFCQCMNQIEVLLFHIEHQLSSAQMEKERRA